MQRTEKRTEKIKQVIFRRQPSLKLVLENIHDPHNVSAIFRTCDAAGIPKVSLVYNVEAFPKVGKKSSASAFKWVNKEKYKSVAECYKDLHVDGFKIFASSISSKSKNLYDLNFTGKIAVVFGNEHRGLSEEAIELAKVEKPELIIMDVMMPGGMDGLEATRILKDNPETKNCKIIMLTAQGQQTEREKGIQAGADDYFVKPFSPLELIRKVEEFLE